MNGFYNILKPTGMSSAAVVAVMRRLTGIKRVGHAGTLDPEAAGVLPIMTGKATRLFDYLTDKEKEYVAVCAFGSRTDTQDSTGEILETGDHYPDRETVIPILLNIYSERGETDEADKLALTMPSLRNGREALLTMVWATSFSVFNDDCTCIGLLSCPSSRLPV